MTLPQRLPPPTADDFAGVPEGATVLGTADGKEYAQVGSYIWQRERGQWSMFCDKGIWPATATYREVVRLARERAEENH